MKRLLAAAILIAFSISIIPNSYAAVTAGSTCKKLGATSTSAGKKYTCVKSGKKLVWNKGVKVSIPKPVATPTPTPTPTKGSFKTPFAKGDVFVLDYLGDKWQLTYISFDSDATKSVCDFDYAAAYQGRSYYSVPNLCVGGDETPYSPDPNADTKYVAIEIKALNMSESLTYPPTDFGFISADGKYSEDATHTSLVGGLSVLIAPNGSIQGKIYMEVKKGEDLSKSKITYSEGKYYFTLTG